MKTGPKEMETAAGLRSHRDAVLAAIRASHAGGSSELGWPLAYCLRRVAWHLLDHAWEMEDKELS